MNGGNAQATQLAVKHGDVAEADNRFGMLHKSGEVELVDDTNAAVAATGHPDGVDVITIHVLLDNGGTKCVATGGDIVDSIETVVENGFETMVMEPTDGIFHFVGGYFTGWGCDGDVHGRVGLSFTQGVALG